MPGEAADAAAIVEAGAEQMLTCYSLTLTSYNVYVFGVGFIGSRCFVPLLLGRLATSSHWSAPKLHFQKWPMAILIRTQASRPSIQVASPRALREQVHHAPMTGLVEKWAQEGAHTANSISIPKS